MIQTIIVRDAHIAAVGVVMNGSMIIPIATIATNT
jgi:hypothetical protein